MALCAGRPIASKLLQHIRKKDQQGKNCRDYRRQQAVLAKVTNHECLQVQKPDGGKKHQRQNYFQKGNCGSIAKRREDGQTEYCEVSGRTDRRERDRSDLGVRAAQYFRTSGNDRATQGCSGHVLHGEINRVAEPNQRHRRGYQVRPGDGFFVSQAVLVITKMRTNRTNGTNTTYWSHRSSTSYS